MTITQKTNTQSGFTLIDLSILLIVIGILMAGFTSQYKQRFFEKTQDTQQENIDSIRDALAFASMNGTRNARGVDLNGDGDFTDTNEFTFTGANGQKLVEKIDNNGNGNYQDAGDTVQPIPNYAAQTAGSTVDELTFDSSLAHNEIISGFSLPCPAPINISFNDANSGVAFEDAPNSGNCDDATMATGFNNGNNGVYIVNGQGGERVIIGAVPYQALDIQPEKTIDAYKNKIFYAISGNATTAGATEDTTLPGRIEVGQPNPVQFTLFSAGPDGLGAFNADGIASADTCPAAGAQRQNCLFTTGDTSANASTFAVQDYVDRDDATHFDDTIAFTFTDGQDSAFFTRGDTTFGAQFDAVNKNAGNMILSYSLTANENLEAGIQLTVGNSAKIGGTGPALTKMDVEGEMKLGMGTGADELICDSDSEGGIRYNNTTKCLEFCDSTDWQEACVPGCVDSGSRYEVGETLSSTSTPVNVGCEIHTTTTTQTCQAGNVWSSSAPTTNTDDSACWNCRRERVSEDEEGAGDWATVCTHIETGATR